MADKYSETTGQPRWVAGRAAANHDEHLDVVVTDASLRQGLVAVRQLGRAGLAVGAVEDEAAAVRRRRSRPGGVRRRAASRAARPTASSISTNSWISCRSARSTC